MRAYSALLEPRWVLVEPAPLSKPELLPAIPSHTSLAGRLPPLPCKFAYWPGRQMACRDEPFLRKAWNVRDPKEEDRFGF